MLKWEKGNTPRQSLYQRQFFHYKCHMMEFAIIIIDPVIERMGNNQDDERPCCNYELNQRDTNM